ncbi:hypothetical protein BG910_02620 [Neisseria chenwenguii]|uniref:Uncharacterized protein n=1 Tax=Neisseria chenwenguii TaxID=1853278 RepID=A0A220RZX6_9NEIS|nr:hypothetical protein BG910_02620 [Neisseria chenwenguii]
MKKEKFLHIRIEETTVLLPSKFLISFFLSENAVCPARIKTEVCGYPIFAAGYFFQFFQAQ